MKTLLILLSTLAISFSATAAEQKTAFRELVCAIDIKSDGQNVSEAPQVEIPEDAFNYTAGMQTFWVPLKASYFDPKENMPREVSIIAAMDKLGANYGLSYLNVKVKNLRTNTIETAFYEIRGDQKNIKHQQLLPGAKAMSVECTLTPGILR